MLPPQANFIRKATVCLHSFISICADSETVGMVIDMEILFGLVIVAVKLILEHVAVRHANKYSDTVVRRYNKNESEEER